MGIWDHEVVVGAAFNPEGAVGGSSFSFDVGHIPYPDLSANVVGFGSGEGYIISSGTRHPEAAWAWVEFLSRQQIDQQMAAEISSRMMAPGLFPARRSVAEEMGYWDQMQEEEAAAYQWALEHQPPMLQRTPDSVGWSVLGEALMPLFSGEEEDVEQALAEAQMQLEERVAEVQLTPTSEPDTGPVTVATPEPQEAPEGAIALSFFSMNASPTELRQIARAFHEEHPDFFIEIASTSVMTGPLELSQLARSYDCFTSSGSPPEEASSSYLLDLQPLFDADPTFSQDDYPAALLAQYRRNGQLIGLPQGFMMRTLHYNRTAFDAAGIMPPSASWTTDDFLAAALALTTGEGDTRQYGYVPVGMPIQDIVFFVRQFGGQLTIGSGEHVQPNYSDPRVVAAIQWYLDLSKMHGVMPPISLPYQRDNQYNNESFELIQSGRAGMWFDYGHGMFGMSEGGEMGTGRNFEVGMSPLPIGGGGLSSDDLGYSESLHISAQADHPQACWEWLKYLSGNVALLRWTIPARMSVAQSEAYLSQAQPGTAELARVYQQTLAVAGATAINEEATEMSDMSYWLLEAINLAMDGKADLDAALVEAQNTASAFQDCVANGGEPSDCAQQVDPDYNGYLLDVGGSVQPLIRAMP
ncbi:MAG: extracellular solute-binding protein [Chloroflexaceae bacterium]|nr:extracellular solute-binding protein [Chloroflexaceae bacterium]